MVAGEQIISGLVNTNSKGLKCDPHRFLSQDRKRIDFDRLEQLAGASVVEAAQFDRQMIVELCKFSALLELSEVAEHHPLDGKLVITAFFEASTRTRLSFESAVLRLDGRVVSVPDGRSTGVAKGESLADIGEMFNSYGDLVIMRHTETSAVQQIRQNLQRPLINAGNGSGEHPTQALVDWYTLMKWRPPLALPECAEQDRITLGIVGTPGRMRAVRSFLLMAQQFAHAIRKIYIISEMADPLGSELHFLLGEDAMIPMEITNDIEPIQEDLDVIYMNSIAFLGDSYQLLDSRYTLSRSSRLKQNAVIMHPFARRTELSTDLDETAHNLYFAQAASAVYIRQALLICLLGRIGRIPASIRLLAQ